MTHTVFVVYTYPNGERYEAMFCQSLAEAQDAAHDFEDIGLKTEIVERTTTVVERGVNERVP